MGAHLRLDPRAGQLDDHARINVQTSVDACVERAETLELPHRGGGQQLDLASADVDGRHVEAQVVARVVDRLDDQVGHFVLGRRQIAGGRIIGAAVTDLHAARNETTRPARIVVGVQVELEYHPGAAVEDSKGLAVLDAVAVGGLQMVGVGAPELRRRRRVDRPGGAPVDKQVLGDYVNDVPVVESRQHFQFFHRAAWQCANPHEHAVGAVDVLLRNRARIGANYAGRVHCLKQVAVNLRANPLVIGRKRLRVVPVLELGVGKAVRITRKGRVGAVGYRIESGRGSRPDHVDRRIDIAYPVDLYLSAAEANVGMVDVVEEDALRFQHLAGIEARGRVVRGDEVVVEVATEDQAAPVALLGRGDNPGRRVYADRFVEVRREVNAVLGRTQHL